MDRLHRNHVRGLVEGLFGSGPASYIAPGLWQGGFPLEIEMVHSAGFDALALCAEELQPSREDSKHIVFRCKLAVVTAPMDDREMSDQELAATARIAMHAATEVVAHIRANRNVLVTCAQGRNRSGFVSALSLMLGFGLSGEAAITRVKSARPNALTNSSFVKFIKAIGR